MGPPDHACIHYSHTLQTPTVVIIVATAPKIYENNENGHETSNARLRIYANGQYVCLPCCVIIEVSSQKQVGPFICFNFRYLLS